MGSMSTCIATPMEEFPSARRPALESNGKGEEPSAIPMPISSRLIGK